MVQKGQKGQEARAEGPAAVEAPGPASEAAGYRDRSSSGHKWSWGQLWAQCLETPSLGPGKGPVTTSPVPPTWLYLHSFLCSLELKLCRQHTL